MSDPAVLAGGRFTIQRRIGAGGMGVVYQAFDRDRGHSVALKKLLGADATAIYRLKNEFRALADVVHPNLVRLYELVGDGDEWFFTMELIDGIDFLHYLRGGSVESDDATTEKSTFINSDRSFSPQLIVGETREEPVPIAIALDYPKLRAAVRQLGEGVGALHAVGKLHRDLKPSNVLVTDDGRVVVLDFGLATDVSPFQKRVTFGGTPAYMAPELIADQPSSAASDCYAIGVMLYEALTGTLPFGGNFYSMLIQKKTTDPRPPAELLPDIPADLSQLCTDLLRRIPEERPTARGLAARVSEKETRDTAAAITLEKPREMPFVGRNAELAQLARAVRDVDRGIPVTVIVRGKSGMGKTALVRAFLHDVQQRDSNVVVFSGRSYEQESVPYKAVDSLIDDLARYLRGVTPLEAKALLPTDVPALGRVFPVLQELAPVAKWRRRAVEIRDSQELRRRAFAALRELMARMADEHRVILFLDDVQWGDRDSASLLAEVLRPPDAPPLLVIICHRTEEAEGSPMLSELKKLRETEHGLGEVREITLGELNDDEARDLARAIVGSDGLSARRGDGRAESPPLHSIDRVESIAREGGGSPFFIVELARFSESTGVVAADVEGDGLVLDRLIRARVALLPEGARELLEIVSVAGRPILATAANVAVNLRPDDEAMLARLRADHLLRTRVRGGRDEVDAYHDRIRAAIVSGLPFERRRAHHLTIARTLEEHGGGDPEVLAVHYFGAGQATKAATYALEAGERAAAALAFDNASHFFAMALGLAGGDPQPDLLIRLADALASAGRGAEASHYYLRAAEKSEPGVARDLLRRASEGLLRAGHVDEGLRIIRSVLDSVGLRLPPTPFAAVLGMFAGRLRLALRGFEYTERAAETIDPRELTRIDVLWAVVTGLARTDNVRSAYFQPIHTRLALSAGEPYRVARALAVEASYSAIRGEKARRRTQKIVSKAERAARRVGDPHVLAMATLARSLESFYLGHFRDSFDKAEEAEAIFREKCTGVAWEINTAVNFALCSLMYLGELGPLAQRVPQRLREAEEHGDLYAGIDLACRPGITWLAADDPESARRALRQMMDRWTVHGFHFQHYLELFAESQIDLYLGNWASAWRRADERWPLVKKAFLLRIPFVKMEGLHLKGRCALAAVIGGGDRSLIDSVERDASAIEGEKSSFATPFATALRAGVASVRGEKEAVAELLDHAARGFEHAEMMLYAHAASMRRGQLIDSRDLIEESESWMRERGVKDSVRLLNVLMPIAL